MGKAELRNLLRVFKFAANEERKAQKMYLKAKEKFSKHEEYAICLNGFIMRKWNTKKNCVKNIFL